MVVDRNSQQSGGRQAWSAVFKLDGMVDDTSMS